MSFSASASCTAIFGGAAAEAVAGAGETEAAALDARSACHRSTDQRNCFQALRKIPASKRKRLVRTCFEVDLGEWERRRCSFSLEAPLFSSFSLPFSLSFSTDKLCFTDRRVCFSFCLSFLSSLGLSFSLSFFSSLSLSCSEYFFSSFSLSFSFLCLSFSGEIALLSRLFSFF